MKDTQQTWNQISYYPSERPLGRDALKGLVENRYAAIVLKNLLSQEILDKSREIIQSNYHKARATQYCNGCLTTIGPYLAKYLNQIDQYFSEAQITASLFPIEWELSYHIREQLHHIFSLESLEGAREKDGQKYSPFVVRLHGDGVHNPLHNDNIMRDAASTDLCVARLTYQLSCVICIQECDQGGHLRHYQKQWHPDDEKYKIENGIGYDSQVVQGKPCFTFQPQTGDVYLINPTNYHEVDRVAGKTRITLGFFIGFFDRELRNAIVWS